MRSQPNGAPKGELVVNTILASDPALVRRMVLSEMKTVALDLWTIGLEGERRLPMHGPGGKIAKHKEDSIRRRVDDLGELMSLMGQIGWR